MQNSEHLLAEIEQFAYCYMLRKEIAIITGCDADALQDEQSGEYKAFMKGRLKRKAELNSNIIQLTKQLSSPAMAIERDIARDTYLNDLK